MAAVVRAEADGEVGGGSSLRLSIEGKKEKAKKGGGSKKRQVVELHREVWT